MTRVSPPLFVALIATLGASACGGSHDSTDLDNTSRDNALAPPGDFTAEDSSAPQNLADADGSATPADDVALQQDGATSSPDSALVAESRGWTQEETEAYLTGSEIVGGIAEQVAEQRPALFVGSAVGPGPMDPPRLYIKGPADSFVTDLVAAAAVQILIVDEQPFSFNELLDRQALLVSALTDLGYVQFSAVFDIEQEGLLLATVQRAADAPTTEAELIASLPASIRSQVRVSIVDTALGELD